MNARQNGGDHLCVKRTLFLFTMASSQKVAVFFVPLQGIVIEALKCSAPFPINQFVLFRLLNKLAHAG
jgi:hypothetical protein